MILGNNKSMKMLLSKIAQDRNLTIRQISIYTRLPKSTVQDCMRENANPKIDTLEKLAKGLNCRIVDLIESKYK